MSPPPLPITPSRIQPNSTTCPKIHPATFLSSPNFPYSTTIANPTHPPSSPPLPPFPPPHPPTDPHPAPPSGSTRTPARYTTATSDPAAARNASWHAGHMVASTPTSWLVADPHCSRAAFRSHGVRSLERTQPQRHWVRALVHIFFAVGLRRGGCWGVGWFFRFWVICWRGEGVGLWGCCGVGK